MSLRLTISPVSPEDGSGYRWCRSGSETGIGLLPEGLTDLPDLVAALPEGLREPMGPRGPMGIYLTADRSAAWVPRAGDGGWERLPIAEAQEWVRRRELLRQ